VHLLALHLGAEADAPDGKSALPTGANALGGVVQDGTGETMERTAVPGVVRPGNEHFGALDLNHNALGHIHPHLALRTLKRDDAARDRRLALIAQLDGLLSNAAHGYPLSGLSKRCR